MSLRKLFKTVEVQLGGEFNLEERDRFCILFYLGYTKGTDRFMLLSSSAPNYV